MEKTVNWFKDKPVDKKKDDFFEPLRPTEIPAFNGKEGHTLHYLCNESSLYCMFRLYGFRKKEKEKKYMLRIEATHTF